jgi:hypothetical protein
MNAPLLGHKCACGCLEFRCCICSRVLSSLERVRLYLKRIPARANSAGLFFACLLAKVEGVLPGRLLRPRHLKEVQLTFAW